MQASVPDEGGVIRAHDDDAALEPLPAQHAGVSDAALRHGAAAALDEVPAAFAQPAGLAPCALADEPRAHVTRIADCRFHGGGCAESAPDRTSSQHLARRAQAAERSDTLTAVARQALGHVPRVLTRAEGDDDRRLAAVDGHAPIQVAA